MEEFKVNFGARAVGGSTKTSTEEWISFLTEGDRYDKTVRTKEEALSLGKPVVLYPDLTDIHKFYAFRRDADMVISLEYKNNSLNELNPGGFVEDQTVLLSELKKALGLPTQRGGRRRCSRKAKKNKAHTPQ